MECENFNTALILLNITETINYHLVRRGLFLLPFQTFVWILKRLLRSSVHSLHMTVSFLNADPVEGKPRYAL